MKARMKYFSFFCLFFFISLRLSGLLGPDLGAEKKASDIALGLAVLLWQ